MHLFRHITTFLSLGDFSRDTPEMKRSQHDRRVAVNFWVPLLVGETKSIVLGVSAYRRFDALKIRFCSHLVSGPRWSQKLNKLREKC